MSDENFLARWSRRKRAAVAGSAVGERTPAPPSTSNASTAPSSAAPVEPAAPAPLPPLESLGIESDFAPFMAREVDPTLQRAALKKLFADERFNVMDGLDVYIDDYTKPAPIPPEWYERMAQMAYLGDAAPRAEPPPAQDSNAEDAAPPPETLPATAAESLPQPDSATGAAADISCNDASPAEARPVPHDGASQ